jgi:hypothetical protein
MGQHLMWKPVQVRWGAGFGPPEPAAKQQGDKVLLTFLTR